jgi:hypothetical protein
MTKSTEFDITQYELKDTGSFTVKTPKGDDLLVNGNPVVITMYGPGSKQFNKANHRFSASNQARLMAAMRDNPVKNAEEQAEKDLSEFLAAVTLSVENWPVPALETYLNPKLPYFKEQAKGFVEKTENFMPGS